MSLENKLLLTWGPSALQGVTPPNLSRDSNGAHGITGAAGTPLYCLQATVLRLLSPGCSVKEKHHNAGNVLLLPHAGPCH